LNYGDARSGPSFDQTDLFHSGLRCRTKSGMHPYSSLANYNLFESKVMGSFGFGSGRFDISSGRKFNLPPPPLLPSLLAHFRFLRFFRLPWLSSRNFIPVLLHRMTLSTLWTYVFQFFPSDPSRTSFRCVSLFFPSDPPTNAWVVVLCF